MNKTILRVPGSCALIVCAGVHLVVVALALSGCSKSPLSPKSQTVATLEDVPVEIELTSDGTASAPPNYKIETQPKLGSLDGKPPHLEYRPHQDAFGSDSFTFFLDPSEGSSSDQAVVNITIQPINDLPIVQPVSLEALEDSKLEMEPVGSDVDGFVESFEIARFPSNGSVSHSQNQFIYVPNADFFGHDSFDYVAIDNEGATSTPATVSISVVPANDIPRAHSLNVSTLEDTPVAILFSATDLDDDDLEYQVSVQPQFGKLAGRGTSRSYTPNSNFHGKDTLEYVAMDSHGTMSESASVSIEVEPVNDAPSAHDMDIDVKEDSSITFELQGTDSDGSIVAHRLVTAPQNGVLTGSGSRRSYTPTEDFYGSDSFQFVVSDESGATSDVATVSISVESTNDSPIARSSTWVTGEDDPGVTIPFKSSDSDGEVVRYEVMRRPRNGSVVGYGLRWEYTPNPDFWGQDSFDFVAVDDLGSRSNVATVTLDVVERPDPPSISVPRHDISTYVGKVIDVDLRVSDPDGDARWFSINQRRRANGQFLPSSGRIREARTLRFEATRRGSQTYRITVEDETGLEDWATVTIHVRNSPPTFERPRPRYNKESGTIEFTLKARDPDGRIDHFVIETIDGRTAERMEIRDDEILLIEESEPFQIGGECHKEADRPCTFTVTYTPDKIDGHSRRIRFYAVDDEGVVSRKDFVRVETRNLRR